MLDSEHSLHEGNRTVDKMMRCLECRHFQAISEIYGKCVIANEKLPTRMANNRCLRWEPLKDKRRVVLRISNEVKGKNEVL